MRILLAFLACRCVGHGVRQNIEGTNRRLTLDSKELVSPILSADGMGRAGSLEGCFDSAGLRWHNSHFHEVLSP